MVELTKKENDILEKAEDVILRQVERYLEAESMTKDDVNTLQTLVVILNRIMAEKRGPALTATGSFIPPC